MSLVQLIVERGVEAADSLPPGIRKSQDAAQHSNFTLGPAPHCSIGSG